MIVACTGHQAFDELTRRNITAAIADAIKATPEGPLIGRCNLAAGADQMFALVVLAAGGRLEAIIPSEYYETTFSHEHDLHTYKSLLLAASTVTTLPFDQPSESAFLAAGQHATDKCDLLLAVWDGQGSAGEGGTADIVAYANDHNIEVAVIWPAGSVRA